MKYVFVRKNKKWFRAGAVVLTALLLVSPYTNIQKYFEKSEKVYADTRSDWEAAKAELKEAIAEVKSLESKSKKTAADLEKASKALTKLIRAQEALERQITSVQAEIDQTNIDLALAQDTLQEEYDSMKLRLQFMYENSSTDSVWAAVLSSESFSEVLNRVDYISQVYDADKKLMDRYEEALHAVEDLQAQLVEKMSDLLDLQSDYEKQQAAVEKTIAMLEEKKGQYSSQIAQAKDKKNQYQQTVDELAEKMRREEAAAAGVNPDSYDGGGSGKGGLGSASYLKDASYDPAFATNVSGATLVSYAMQYVGSHYVWAGNTLGCQNWNDNIGVDCSGFVHQVYLHFGINTPRYSQSFKTVGQPVAYANIKAGDVVVYPGHVAIYIGNGCIVEAQGSKKGVTCNRRVDCHTITAIRRLL